MDKFEVKRQYNVSDVGFRMINVRQNDFYALKQMQEETGMKLVDLVHSMILFCAERLSVIENESEE